MTADWWPTATRCDLHGNLNPLAPMCAPVRPYSLFQLAPQLCIFTGLGPEAMAMAEELKMRPCKWQKYQLDCRAEAALSIACRIAGNTWELRAIAGSLGDHGILHFVSSTCKHFVYIFFLLRLNYEGHLSFFYFLENSRDLWKHANTSCLQKKLIKYS